MGREKSGVSPGRGKATKEVLSEKKKVGIQMSKQGGGGVRRGTTKPGKR